MPVVDKRYQTVILRVVLYENKTWSSTLKKERRLRAFDNGMLKRLFGPRSDEVTRC